MTALVFFVVVALVFAVVWINMAKKPGRRAKLGPDGTNVREPETFVVHHEGKGQGLDIANTALKERTEHLRKDLPGDAHELKTRVPGRDMIRMDEPPSDISRYGSEKVAPGAESKEKVLKEGPIGSRPETPEEPGSPYAKGRRVTDNHRDVELAADLLPNVAPGKSRRLDKDMAASPSTNGQEPGYGLGRTQPGETDGEGGQGSALHANTFENSGRGRVVPIRPRQGEAEVTLQQEGRDAEQAVEFHPDTTRQEPAEGMDWSHLHEDHPVADDPYGEDAIVAMVRNPRSLYVYWETRGHGDENLRAMLSEEEWQSTVPCLRVFDVTNGAYPGQKGGDLRVIALQEQDDHCFVDEGIEPGHRYAVSYERRTPDGQFYLMSHSNPVSMPNEGPDGSGPLYQIHGRQPSAWSGSPWR